MKERGYTTDNVVKRVSEPGLEGMPPGVARPRRPSRILRAAIVAVLLGSALLALAGVGGRALLRAGLSALDGTYPAPALSHEATIERDALGVPTISAGSSADLAYATGFAHAQDRFFQMDLLRRVAAGELAALIGPAAVELDRTHRLHRFRARAHQIAAALDSNSRALLKRYAAGVKDGLASLRGRPFEN